MNKKSNTKLPFRKGFYIGTLSKPLILSQFTDLFIAAYERVKKDRHSKESLNELFGALSLFSEGRLRGYILPLEKEGKPIGAMRREEFKTRLQSEGHDILWREFCERVSNFTRNRLKSLRLSTLRELAGFRRSELTSTVWLGQGTLKEIEDALFVYGLYIDMTEEELVNIFGPLPKKKLDSSSE